MNTNLKISGLSDSAIKGYSPSQIRKAYSLNNIGSGAGIKIAVIDFIGNDHIQDNLNVFSSQFDLPPIELIIRKSPIKNTSFNFGAYIEPCIDTQWIHAIAPDASIEVVRAESFSAEGVSRAILSALENNADIILQTFQAPFLSEYVSYSDMYNSDVVFVASAGDYGAGAFFPSCFPQCISVGGTSLLIDKDGNRKSEETAWRGTGGGICEYFDIPFYQKEFRPIEQLTNGKRGVPDISFLADPDPGYAVYHSSTGDRFGWYTAGGTSLSAAVCAGIFACFLSLNSGFDKKSVLSNLYILAGKTSYKNDYNKFVDITTGDNGEYFASEGYDLCTGLGSLFNL